MTYVDGYVLVVSKKNVRTYRKMASEGGKIWKKCGALQYFECIGDDLHPNMGGMKIQSFDKMTKLKRGETVWFSFVTYKSKAHRNSVNKKVMKMMETEMEKYKDQKMPWDMKRFAYGGFKAIVEE